MSKWYASCFILCLEKEREPDNWMKLHVGGINETSCPAFARDGDKFASKTLGMARRKSSHVKHGSVIRPTMCLASLDIKTAFDEARPCHVAESTKNHDRHGLRPSERCPNLSKKQILRRNRSRTFR